VTDLTQGKATLCVVNHKTLDMTRLWPAQSSQVYGHTPMRCSSSTMTPGTPPWTTCGACRGSPLMERRPAVPDRTGACAHGAALGHGAGCVPDRVLCRIALDTVVTSPTWLTMLINLLAEDPGAASAGGDKIDPGPLWRACLRKATDMNALWRRFFASAATRRRYGVFNRTICTAYRTEVLRKEGSASRPFTSRG